MHGPIEREGQYDDFFSIGSLLQYRPELCHLSFYRSRLIPKVVKRLLTKVQKYSNERKNKISILIRENSLKLQEQRRLDVTTESFFPVSLLPWISTREGFHILYNDGHFAQGPARSDQITLLLNDNLVGISYSNLFHYLLLRNNLRNIIPIMRSRIPLERAFMVQDLIPGSRRQKKDGNTIISLPQDEAVKLQDFLNRNLGRIIISPRRDALDIQGRQNSGQRTNPRPQLIRMTDETQSSQRKDRVRIIQIPHL